MTTSPLALLLVALTGCAVTATTPEPVQPAAARGDANAELSAELAALRKEIAHLTNRVNHLETDIKASDPTGEFKQMTIDSVRWADAEFAFAVHNPGTDLLCRVVEWSGYPRMLRFTRKSDHTFTLEAPGHAPVDAVMSEGGTCNDTGSTRFVMLSLRGRLEPGVEYSIRPRNESADYKWIVPATVVVTAK
jgi:hypothetical protein